MLEVFARPHFSKDNRFVESLFGPTKRVPKLNGRLWTVSKRLSILPAFFGGLIPSFRIQVSIISL
jgi:hypothetical protein